MKLHIKLILYNLFVKAAIITILTILIIIVLDRISLSHLKNRILDKREKLVRNLSSEEIADLLEAEKTFTDYNILKEEYIILTKTAPMTFKAGHVGKFSVGQREIEGSKGDYLIFTSQLRYGADYYRLEIGETMAAVKQLKSTFLFFSFLTLIFMALLTLITDYAFTSYLLAPFYRIIEQKIDKVNEPLHFNHESIPTTTTDFQHLDKSINALMNKLKQQFLTQKQFTSNVSHELLTPVSVIKSRLENILSNENISEAAETKVMASLKTLNRMKSIINSLLLISKVENNQYEKNEHILLPTLLADVMEDLEDRITLKEIQFINRLQHNFSFHGNKTLIHTLFINIINNAIKYNKQNGSITVSDEISDGYYNISITDEGAGMSPYLIEKAFNRFEKLNSTDNESNGLGLAIVKSIAAFHNISVAINSEINKGTTVEISIAITHASCSF